MPPIEPRPVQLRSRDGLTLAALHWPAPPTVPGVVVVHGADSRKENHADFAARASEAGLGVLALDLRGHGQSDAAPPSARFIDDVLAGLDHLAAAGHAALGLRGSSLGGFLALHAAGRHALVRAVAAICPARPLGLARRYQAEWPLHLPLEAVVAHDDRVARGYWHATGDEVVPWGHSFALAQRSPQPRRLRVVMGGGHQSLQPDPAIQAETIAFLWTHLAP